MAYIHKKNFNNTRGLDLRSSDLNRPSASASSMSNAIYRQTGAISKRPGFQKRALTNAGAGSYKFIDVDITTGIGTEVLLGTDDNLNKVEAKTFSTTYSGSGVAYYDMYLHTDGKFYFDVYADNTRVLNQDVGTGLEASPVTVNTLVTNINALSDFTCTATGSPSTRS